MIYSSDTEANKKNTFIVPDELNMEKVWLLDEGNCLRNQFENICHLKENTLKPKNLDFLASNIQTLVHMVDKVGGISILPELALNQLSEEQKTKVFRFKKPFPYREISIIYYKPTFKQKIIDELGAFIKSSVDSKLNFNKNPKEFVSIKPQ